MIIVSISSTVPLLIVLLLHDLVCFQNRVQEVIIVCIILSESLQWEVHKATLIPAHSLSLVNGSAGTRPSIRVLTGRAVFEKGMCPVLAAAVAVVGLLLCVVLGYWSDGTVVLRFCFGLAANVFLTMYRLTICHTSHERSTTVIRVDVRHNIAILARTSVGTI